MLVCAFTRTVHKSYTHHGMTANTLRMCFHSDSSHVVYTPRDNRQHSTYVRSLGQSTYRIHTMGWPPTQYVCAFTRTVHMSYTHHGMTANTVRMCIHSDSPHIVYTPWDGRQHSTYVRSLGQSRCRIHTMGWPPTQYVFAFTLTVHMSYTHHGMAANTVRIRVHSDRPHVVYTHHGMTANTVCR